jgi:hypothetical protein
MRNFENVPSVPVFCPRVLRAVASFMSTNPEIFMWQTQHSALSTRRGRPYIVAPMILAFTICFAPASAQPAKVPQFQDYRVSDPYRGAVKSPDFGNLERYSGTELRCYGGDPEEYTKKRANFAGHFVIDICSCGSGCHYLFLWDALTGKFYHRFPFGSINVGPYGLGAASRPIEYEGEQYRLDSSLLILEACIEDTCDCARRYYSWNGSQFQLILKQASSMPPNCQK